MSTAVHGAQVKEPHDKGEKAVGFMVSTTTGNRVGVNGLKDRMSRHLRAFWGDKVRSLAYYGV